MSQTAPASSLVRQLVRECEEMASYALSSGLEVPHPVVRTVERSRTLPDEPDPDFAPLVDAHARLSRIVAPATPRALILFAEHGATGWMRHLGPVRIVQQMMLAALGSVVLFVLSSLSRSVNHSSGGVMDNAGLALLVNEVFWLSSAGIGASFAMLFHLNEFVANRNYDSKNDASYWIKFMVGVIGGFILVALVPMESLTGEGGSGAAGSALSAEALARPTVAMLGGFSASAVYRILNRLVTAVEGLFGSDPGEDLKQRGETARASAAAEALDARMKLLQPLTELQHLAAGEAPDEVTRRIGEIVASLFPRSDEAEAGSRPVPPPPAAPADKVPVPALADHTGIVAQADTPTP